MNIFKMFGNSTVGKPMDDSEHIKFGSLQQLGFETYDYKSQLLMSAMIRNADEKAKFTKDGRSGFAVNVHLLKRFAST